MNLYLSKILNEKHPELKKYLTESIKELNILDIESVNSDELIGVSEGVFVVDPEEIKSSALIGVPESVGSNVLFILLGRNKIPEAFMADVFDGKIVMLEYPSEKENLIKAIESKLKILKDENVKDKRMNEFDVKERLQNALKQIENLEKEIEELKLRFEERGELNEKLKAEIKEKNLLLAALRFSESKFRLLFEFNEDIIFFLRLEAEEIKIEDANETAVKLLGYSREDFIKKNIYDLYVNNKDEVKRKLLSVINTNAKREYLTHSTKSGKSLKVEIMAHRITVGDKDFVYLDERNITKEQELNLQIRKLSQIIEQNPIAVMMTDSTGRIEYVNRNMIHLSGYSEEEIVGRKPSVFSPSNLESEQAKNLVQTIRGGDIWFGKLNMQNKNNDVLILSVVAFPITNEEGVITNYVGILRDISSEEEMIRELRAAKEEAQKANKLKDEFIARISHEIRTPLNTIINFIQILFEELPETKNNIIRLSKDAIIDASKRIVRTIDLILNISLIESGNFKLKIERFDVFRDCLKGIIRQYSYIAKQKGLNFIQTIETKDFVIEADRDSVYQVFINLIDNAVKFTDKGYIEIRILRDEKDRLVVQVTDTGKGISEKYLPKIFEPFTQERMGYSREYEGVGLGMALVKKYCDLNNAEIQVFSNKQIGTKVVVKFNT